MLTVLPKTCSIRKVEKEFNVSNYMARKSKKLVQLKGVLSTPNPKLGNTIREEAVSAVIAFYNNDEISRQMKGKKDCVTMDISGKKEKIQKRLIMCNLKEAYQKVKEENDIKIVFRNLQP